MEQHFESLYPPQSREKEIGQILSCIKEGNFFQTVSLPGGGRSNLLGLLSYNKNVRLKHLGGAERTFHFVTYNFSEIRNKPINDAIEFLLLGLIDSLEEKQMQEAKTVRTIFKENLPSKDEIILFHALKRAIEYLALEKNLTVVFLFDRFDEYIPSVTMEFFADLRILRNLAKYKFSIIFSLNRPLENLIDPEIFNDVYEFIAGYTVYLPLYDKLSTDFRINYIEKAIGRNIDKKSLDQILDITAGHGKLTRICAEIVLAASGQRLASSLELEKLFFSQKPIQKTLLDIWASFTPAEQELLASSGQRLASSYNQENHIYLENVGILKNGKITIKLLSDFIKQNHPQTQDAQIVFDEISKEIRKGSLLISDKLTLHEYDLLIFLLQNTDKIIQRDEIINSVWKNSASTIGVTDQALDQLVFRIRHKIENDPNNPTHLLTIKGRGFRFLP